MAPMPASYQTAPTYYAPAEHYAQQPTQIVYPVGGCDDHVIGCGDMVIPISRLHNPQCSAGNQMGQVMYLPPGVVYPNQMAPQQQPPQLQPQQSQYYGAPQQQQPVPIYYPPQEIYCGPPTMTSQVLIDWIRIKDQDHQAKWAVVGCWRLLSHT